MTRSSEGPARARTLALAALLGTLLAAAPGCTGSTAQSAAGLAPVAAFTSTPASPVAGDPITFTDTSANAPTAWAWDFGDGATSTAQNPTHAYAAAGAYTVTLVATNAWGASPALLQGVTVAAAQVAGGPASCTLATAATDCAAPGACPSDALAGCACASMSQGWVCVPQCATDADCPKPPDQALACLGGLCVRGVDPGGQAPAAGFTFSPSTPMATQAVAFSDASTNGPTAWAWDFGDGATSTAQNPAHAYASSGSYTVSLTATNASGANTLARTVTVAPYAAGKVVASFSWAPASPVGGQAVTFTDTSTGSPTSWFWRFGDGGTSTAQHPTHTYSAATASGAHIVSLVVSTATSTEMVNQDVTVKAAPKAAGTMSSVDTLSDQAQAMTIAFDGLAFVTGNFCAQTFYPPGKVADHFGFQWLRDNDPSGLGHNTEFTTLTADPIIALLTDTQLAVFDQLQVDEGSLNDAYGYARFPLALAFRRLADGTGPATTLSRQAVRSYTGSLFAIDGEMSYLRATAYASVLRSLSASQQATLASMKATYQLAAPAGGVGQWTQPDPAVVAAALKKHPGQMLRTYAGEMLAWYLGTTDADVYFCPERQATYFGSFFMKDVKAMNNTASTIDSNMTADMGNAFLTALDAGQKAKVTGLVALQKPDLMGIMAKRDQLSRLLRTALAGATLDEAAVLRLSEQYGELDGEISYFYATSFAGVSTTLTSAQKATLLAERQKATTQTTPTVADFDALCGNGYLYSAKLQSAPVVRNTDFLFGICSAAGASCTADWDCCSYACTGSGARTCAAPFTFTSPAFADGVALPTAYTCSNPTLGNDAPSPPLSWSGAPAGTVEYAVTLTTYGLDGKRWNWILYGIPASATGLDAGNTAGLGTYGLSTDGPTRRYYPPCAQGAGTFSYTITLHALSGSPTFGVPASQVDGYLLEEAIGKLTIASRQLTVTNTR